MSDRANQTRTAGNAPRPRAAGLGRLAEGLILLLIGAAISGQAAPGSAGNGAEDQEAEYRRERRSYVVGFLLALLLTAVPFALVYWSAASVVGVLAAIAACALLQIVVHFRFFLHIDLSRQKREDLELILFSTLILAIMIGGTIWIMANLATRMH